MVIDRETGQTPPTAAERMDAHDRRMGTEPNRPAARVAPVEVETIREAAPTPQRDPPRPSTAAAQNRKQPWSGKAKDAGEPHPARIPQRRQPQQQAGGRKTIVTAKWWDSKGPRTIELGPKGQAELTGGFMMFFFGVVIAAIIALVIAPVLLFIGAFLLFRFGGDVLGPIGARLVDKALNEKG